MVRRTVALSTTRGRNFNNARVVSANILSGTNPLLTVSMGNMTASDRLHITVEEADNSKAKYVIDTGSPNSHRFILKNKPDGLCPPKPRRAGGKDLPRSMDDPPPDGTE